MQEKIILLSVSSSKLLTGVLFFLGVVDLQSGERGSDVIGKVKYFVQTGNEKYSPDMGGNSAV